ncbi:hypothetical protein [Corynebacterium epidermidicanis]|uniref:X-X-X-Leu-X-X-Gly heptad repeat-containing protein n=1 Tax=Corynebacterium epidermidicanis TaxID=1050174 RepID=A0A0G3GTL5_9CORY|nr:hypothetical protein [Corynebacterium epidermidicanis]AKK02152.1 X-X-X-Leu-X-X-Gly heptad repeat-containing protein [Corynebacterium epidermidicanis]
MRPIRRLLFALLLVLPLIGGAAYSIATNSDPSAAWSSPDEPSAAPGAADLVPARRAAGEASSQAGFLIGGTKELSSGAGQLADGTGKLAEGGHTAAGAANELSNGMVQLQAGTGQLGDGAVKVADGVQQAVDQVQGIGLIQMQIVREIDRVSAELEKDKSPEAAEFRKQLAGFRTQVEQFKLDGAMVDQLSQLRTGSREIANQLAVPGYGFHDGIYSATKGSKELATGLAELDAGLAEASNGANQLRDGAVKVDNMAAKNKEKIGAVQRALPADVAPAAEEPMPTLIPLLGFLISALVMVGCSLTSRFGFVAVLLMGALAALVLATDLTPVVGAGLVATVILAGLAAGFLARGLVAVFGPRWGSYVMWAGLLVQIGAVGFVWKLASRADISPVLGAVSAFMPMHYSTGALTSAGNSGSTTVLGVSLGVLAATAVCGFLVSKFAGYSASVGPEENNSVS